MSDLNDTARRLRDPLKGWGFHNFDGTRFLGRGTVFPLTEDTPGGLQQGDRFQWIDDVGWVWDAFYNALTDFSDDEDYFQAPAWLTVAESALTIPVYTQATTTAGIAGAVEIRRDYPIFVTRVAIGLNLASPHDGSTNHWQVSLLGVTADNATTSSLCAAGRTDPGWYSVGLSLGFASPVSAWARLVVNLGKTGSPGAITANVTAYHRLILNIPEVGV